MQDSENAGMMDLRHFAFYAFAGRTGTVRWTRKNEVVPLALDFGKPSITLLVPPLDKSILVQYQFLFYNQLLCFELKIP